MDVILLVGSGLYVLFSMVLIFGNARIKKRSRSSKEELSVTVLVPFRNEEGQLSRLANSLLIQSYSSQKFEVLFIDDHSDDEGVQIIQEGLKDAKFSWQILDLGLHQGKKRGIDLGIQNAKGELILCTDADSYFTEDWIRTMVNSFGSTRADLLVGPVGMSNSEWWSPLMELEFAGLIASTSGSIASGLPFLCNGANLAYRRKLYYDIQPFQSNWDLASGDDVFFMQAAIQKNKRISFAASSDALVYTSGPNGLQAFIKQRIRWAKKSGRLGNPFALLVGLLILGINLLILTLLMSGNGFDLLFLFALKLICDYFILRSAKPWLQLPKSMLWVFALSLVYPFYSIGIALLSLFLNPNWKKRKLRAHS